VASIDKLYGTWEQYDEFYSWCAKYNPGALEYFYFYDWKDDQSHPMTNFPERYDKWLLKNCTLDFVIQQIKEQYGIEDVHDMMAFLGDED